MKISYGPSEAAWSGYAAYLEQLVSRPNVQRVCEVGGGANPALSLEAIQQHRLEYTVLDLSDEELAKAPDGYLKAKADIASRGLRLSCRFDLVLSRMFAEHVPSGRDFHANVWELLSEGGMAFHFFPTLYAPPFVLNRLLSDALTERLLHLVQEGRGRSGRHAKFPAYYSWCRGPLSGQIKRFERLGYRVEEYKGFFGFGGYLDKLQRIKRAEAWVSSVLVNHPVPLLTSYAYVLLSKVIPAHQRKTSG